MDAIDFLEVVAVVGLFPLLLRLFLGAALVEATRLVAEIELRVGLEVDLLALAAGIADGLTIADLVTPELFGDADGLRDDLEDVRLAAIFDLLVIEDGERGSLSF